MKMNASEEYSRQLTLNKCVLLGKGVGPPHCTTQLFIPASSEHSLPRPQWHRNNIRRPTVHIFLAFKLHVYVVISETLVYKKNINFRARLLHSISIGHNCSLSGRVLESRLSYSAIPPEMVSPGTNIAILVPGFTSGCFGQFRFGFRSNTAVWCVVNIYLFI